MTDSPYRLSAIEFSKAEQARLVGFSCGQQPWERHVTEWILGSDVFDSIQRGTRVWLFETADGQIVGFGSVGTSVWRWPPPDGQRIDDRIDSHVGNRRTLSRAAPRSRLALFATDHVAFARGGSIARGQLAGRASWQTGLARAHGPPRQCAGDSLLRAMRL